MLQGRLCPDPAQHRSPHSPRPPSGSSAQSPSRKQGWEHPLRTENRVRGGQEQRGFTKPFSWGRAEGLLVVGHFGHPAAFSSSPKQWGGRAKEQRALAGRGLSPIRSDQTQAGLWGGGTARSRRAGRCNRPHCGLRGSALRPAGRAARRASRTHGCPSPKASWQCRGLGPRDAAGGRMCMIAASLGLGVPKIPAMASASSQSCSAGPPECRPSRFLGVGFNLLFLCD